MLHPYLIPPLSLSLSRSQGDCAHGRGADRAICAGPMGGCDCPLLPSLGQDPDAGTVPAQVRRRSPPPELSSGGAGRHLDTQQTDVNVGKWHVL